MGRNVRRAAFAACICVSLAVIAPAVASAASKAATKTPVKIGVIYQTGGVTTVEYQGAANAAAQSLNKSGALDGIKLEVVGCDTKSTAEGSQACWRQFTSDPSIVGIVGADFQDQTSSDVATAANIPMVDFYPTSKLDTTSPMAFTGSNGINGSFPGAALYAIRNGAKSIGFVRLDIAVGDSIEALVRPVVESHGGKITDVERLSLSQTDLTPNAQALKQANPDAIVVALSATQNAPMVRALRQQGYTGPIVITGTSVTNQQLTDLGVDTKGIAAVTNLAPIAANKKNAGMKQMAADWKKYSSDVPLNDSYTHAWLGVQMIGKALSGDKAPSRASLAAALAKQTKMDTLGLTPPLDFTKAGPFPVAPRLVNPYVAFIVSDGKQWTWDGKLVDVTEKGKDINALKAAP